MRTGNLLHRWAKQKLRKEVFTYDELDRLTSAQVHTTSVSGDILQGHSPLTYQYDGSMGSTRGSLIKRTDIGKYGTNAHGRISGASGLDYPIPHDDPPLAILPGTQNITYSSFHQPTHITEDLHGDPYLLRYAYDANQQRRHAQLQYNLPGEPPLEERWYDHGLETQRFDGDNATYRKILFVEGGEGLCAMILAGPGASGAWEQVVYSVYKDHLGSLVELTKATPPLTACAPRSR